MKNILFKYIQGKNILFLFTLTNLVYILMLTTTIPNVMRFSSQMNLFDMMPTGYDAAYANMLLNMLGEEGRNAYLFNQIPVDMIYPFLFGISYCLVFIYFLKKLNREKGLLFYGCLLPVIAGLADYFENIGIIFLLNSYPNITNFSVSLTNFFTILKSGTTSAFFVLLIIMLLILGIKSLKKSFDL